MIGIGITLMVQGLYDSYQLAGIVTAVLSVTNAVGAPLVGRLIDRHGQRRIGLPLIATFAVSVSTLIALSVAHAPGWTLCCAAAVAGLSTFPIGSLSRSRWSHLLDRPQDVQTAFSIEAVLDDTAFMFGPSFATLLATSVAPIAGVVCAVVFLLAGGLLYLAQRATEPPVHGRRVSAENPSGVPALPSAEPRDNRTALFESGVPAVCVVFVTMGLFFGSNNITMVAVCELWGAKWAAGPILAGGSLASMAGALLYGARKWQSPLWKRFVVCLLIQAAASSMFLFAGSFPVLILINFCSGIAVSPSFINGNALIERIVPPHKLTEGLTWIGTGCGVGMAAGSAVAGSFIDTWGARSGYWIVATAAISGMATALLSAPTLRRRTTPTNSA
jgi:MFS family permease